jgi:hypothetical protein
MRKRTKRKIWSTEINPIAHAIAGACVTDQPSLDKLRLAELAALDAMSKGLGSVQDWRSLADMVNICETMADNGIGPEASPYCTALQEDLIAAAHRFEKTGRMGLTGKGLNAAKEVFEYHDVQRVSISRSDYERMIEKTRNRIKSNHHKVVNIK